MDTMLVSQGKLEGKLKADEAYERKKQRTNFRKRKRIT